jgi:hypothetical protein
VLCSLLGAGEELGEGGVDGGGGRVFRGHLISQARNE